MSTGPSKPHPTIEGDALTMLGQVCTLNDDELTARWREIRDLLATALDVAVLANGVDATFPRNAHTEQRITELVRRERVCCARFTYRVDAGDDAVHVRIRARGADAALFRMLYRLKGA